MERKMNSNDANTALIINEIRGLSGRISDLPSKADVRVAVMEGIQQHEDRCQGRNAVKQVAENTGVIKTMAIGLRNSVAPAGRRLARVPLWLKIVAAALSTLSAAGAVVAALI
jgi:hypothetical protein